MPALAREEQTDPILLAEIMGMRTLMLNLFARASEGPLTTEDLRKMSAYSDSIKEQKAQEFMAAEASPEQYQNHGQAGMKLSRIRFAFPWRIAADPGPCSMPPVTRVLGMVPVGSPTVAAVLFRRLLGQFRRRKAACCADPNPMAHGDGSRTQETMVHRLRCHGRKPERSVFATLARRS